MDFSLNAIGRKLKNLAGGVVSSVKSVVPNLQKGIQDWAQYNPEPANKIVNTFTPENIGRTVQSISQNTLKSGGGNPFMQIGNYIGKTYLYNPETKEPFPVAQENTRNILNSGPQRQGETREQWLDRAVPAMGNLGLSMILSTGGLKSYGGSVKAPKIISGNAGMISKVVPKLSSGISEAKDILKSQGDEVLDAIETNLPILHKKVFSNPNALNDIGELDNIKTLLTKNKETPEDLRKATEILMQYGVDTAQKVKPIPQIPPKPPEIQIPRLGAKEPPISNMTVRPQSYTGQPSTPQGGVELSTVNQAKNGIYEHLDKKALSLYGKKSGSLGGSNILETQPIGVLSLAHENQSIRAISNQILKYSDKRGGVNADFNPTELTRLKSYLEGGNNYYDGIVNKQSLSKYPEEVQLFKDTIDNLLSIKGQESINKPTSLLSQPSTPQGGVPPVEGGVGGVPQVQPFQKDLERFTALVKQNDKYGQGVPAIGRLPSSQAVAEQMGITHEELMNQVLGKAGKPLPQTLPSAPSEVIQPKLRPLPEIPSEEIQPQVKPVEQVDPFIQQLETARNQPRNQYPATILPNDSATKQSAMGSAGGFTGNIADDVKNTFADWTNSRAASRIEGLLKRREFADLDAKGIDGILEFQSGPKTGRMGDVKKFLDEKYKIVKDSGIDVNYKKNYLPQLWENSMDEVQSAMGRRLGKNPSFALHSLITDYKEGIELGLTPKFKTIGELVGWYERTANKIVADVNFFNRVAKEGLIQPSGKTPLTGWKTLNPDSFPKVTVNIPGEGRYTGTYSAPSELADMINNYLSTPETGNTLQRGLTQIAEFTSAVKNRALSFGIPGTGINMHGVNILARNTLFGKKGNVVSRWGEGINYMLRPNEAEKVLVKELEKAPFAIKNGLTFSIEDHKVLTEDPGMMGKFGAKWSELFEKPLFEKMLPALKLKDFYAVFDEYKKMMPEKEAAREAAKITNDVYGGINWQQLGKSRDVQNIKRILILAPDWLQTNINLGAKMVGSLLHPKNLMGKAYRRMATALFGAYVSANVVNKIINGHFMFENDRGHTFEIQMGYDSGGQKRWFRPWGTAVDFVRLPFDIAAGLLNGDMSVLARTVRNRLSIPAGVGLGAMTDVDYRGKPIGYSGKDKYDQDMPLAQRIGGIAGEIATFFGLPSFVKQGIDTATGKQSLEAGLLQGLELPFRYSGGAYSKTQQKIAEIAKEQGITGEELGKLNELTSGKDPLSDNQLEQFRMGGVDYLNALYKDKEENSVENKVKKVYEEEGIVPPETSLEIKANLLHSELKKAIENEDVEAIKKIKASGLATPEVKAKVKEYQVLEDNGIMKSDRELVKFQGTERALKVIERLKTFTPKNRVAHLEKLYDAGIVTPDVLEEIKRLVQEAKK